MSDDEVSGRRIEMMTLSYVMSVIALLLYSISYFFESKKNYLILQLIGNVFLSLSYLNIGTEYPILAVIVWLAERPKSSSLELLKMSASP